MLKSILAVQVPAPCPLACAFCRSPEHNVGDPEKVLAAVLPRLDGCSEIYITSNGETGLSPIFRRLVSAAQGRGVPVSVLCATQKSVKPGLKRVEISVNEYTRPLALQAIAKARELGVPFVISTVDDGECAIDPEALALEHGADGAIVRALQREGLSDRAAGKTGIYQRPGSTIGSFPVSAYGELKGQGYVATCIDHFGNEVPMLGSYVQ